MLIFQRKASASIRNVAFDEIIILISRMKLHLSQPETIPFD
jgi:hypothetical protein